MSRASRIACLLAAALLVPAHAEAAKMRFGGNKSSPNASQARPAQASSGRAVVVVPGLGIFRARAAEPGAPTRVPFPSATAQALQATPVALHASDDAARKPWCRSEVVVGGFCVLN
jgi:hypothetical protein